MYKNSKKRLSNSKTSVFKDRTFFESKIETVKDDIYQGLSHDKLTDKLREISHYGAIGNLL